MFPRTLPLIALAIALSAPAFPDTKVIILGAGTPTPQPDRSGPAVAILVDGRAYLVDAGTGVVRRATAAYEKTKDPALYPSRLGHVFITHLHSDHTLGYADLILTPWVIGKSTPLQAYGPPGLKEMTGYLLKAYNQDLRIRMDGIAADSPQQTLVTAHDIEPGVIFQDTRVKVTAFQVPHGTWRYAYGYRFDTKDRVVVISGDTAPSEELVKQAKGCDVLVHEVYSAKALKERAWAGTAYHTTFHTSGVELGKLAARIQPGLLVLYHQLAWSTEEEIMSEVRQNYDGPLEYGDDLDVF